MHKYLIDVLTQRCKGGGETLEASIKNQVYVYQIACQIKLSGLCVFVLRKEARFRDISNIDNVKMKLIFTNLPARSEIQFLIRKALRLQGLETMPILL